MCWLNYTKNRDSEKKNANQRKRESERERAKEREWEPTGSGDCEFSILQTERKFRNATQTKWHRNGLFEH